MNPWVRRSIGGFCSFRSTGRARPAGRLCGQGVAPPSVRRTRQYLLSPRPAGRGAAAWDVQCGGARANQRHHHGSGFALRICDALNEARFDTRTADVVGTVEWTTLRLEVTIAHPARLMAIEIVRDPSEKFDSAISGTAWVDDVKIVRQRR